MAHLPALRTQKAVSDGYTDSLVAHLAAGRHPGEIARQLHPGKADRPARRALYRKLRRLALDDPRIAVGITEEARLAMMADLVPTVKALGQRAKRGRPDAAKILLEATGFHNPRVKHEHSGEIKVKLDMPRPRFEQHEVSDQVTDAEVVD